jgi:hypothetical protein
MYALDTDTGKALWVSSDTATGSWNKRYVASKQNLYQEFPVFGDESVRTGPAQAASLPAPTVTVMSDSTSGSQRTVTLSIKPQRSVRLVYFEVDGATVTSATVDGRSVSDDGLKDLGITFHAPPADGLPVTLTLSQTGPVKIRVMDGSDGLDGLPGFSPRPPGVGVEGSHDTELVLVAKTYTV